MEKRNESTGESIAKVVVIGPESTGKSTLSSKLAAHYNTSWVREYAREYLDNLGRPYHVDDLLKIAHGQLENEDKELLKARNLLICDTNLIVIKIWSEYKYGYCHEDILNEIKSRKYDLYLLTDVDIPWESDPQRENPNLRTFFYDLFKATLENLKLPYKEINGEGLKREQEAIKAIDELLNTQESA